MVGEAIRKSGIDRSKLFVTTKLWNNSHKPEEVEKALDASLKDLGMDYVDLYLIHWPSAFRSGDNMFPKDKDSKIETANISYVDTWKAMEKLLTTGKAKAIGVFNFSKRLKSRLSLKKVRSFQHPINLNATRGCSRRSLHGGAKVRAFTSSSTLHSATRMRFTTLERTWES
jgi:diketogulonate reductase-like aldo/keto reductase